MCKVIGIDISKASFDISYRQTSGDFLHEKFSNNEQGFKSFRKHIHVDDHCIMEASGPYYLKLAYYIHQAQICVSVVNPLQIKHFVRMRMVKAKTDKKDAQMIAVYGEREQPAQWVPDDLHVSKIQQIHTAIEGLHKQASVTMNQLEAFKQHPNKDSELCKVLSALLRSIRVKISRLEDRMIEITLAHYQDTFLALKSIPGIGDKTAMMLIALTNDFTKFNSSKKLSSYVGMIPRIYESGTSIKGKGHITKMGNRYMRKLLYMCAWTAKKNNKQCKQMYERLKENGKPEKLIKIAIANKLLRQAYAVGTTHLHYQNNFC
jgi:transposase